MTWTLNSATRTSSIWVLKNSWTTCFRLLHDSWHLQNSFWWVIYTKCVPVFGSSGVHFFLYVHRTLWNYLNIDWVKNPPKLLICKGKYFDQIDDQTPFALRESRQNLKIFPSISIIILWLTNLHDSLHIKTCISNQENARSFSKPNQLNSPKQF